MPLKLTITSFQRLSPGQETSQILDHGSLSIGRTAQNGWTLQDPERILSSNHCLVHVRDGGYFLTDTSTNGTFLNDSEQRIPRNQTVPLKDGDHFVLGEYEIEVSLLPGAAELMSAEAEPEGPLTDVVLTPPGLPSAGIANLGGGQDVLGRPSFADLLAEDHPDASDHLDLRRPAANNAVATEPPPDLLTPERAFFEAPELAAGIPPVPPLAPPPVLAGNLPAIPIPAGFEPQIPGIPDFAVPPAGSIPELIATPTGLALAPSADTAIIPDDWWLAPSAAAVVESPKAAILPLPVEPVPVTAPPAPPPIPSAPPIPPPSAPAGLTGEALMRVFLDSAGLPRARPHEEQWLEIMANLGAIFHETVQGLSDILLARSDVKGEFRLDRTAIGPIENNPLKTPPGQPPLRPEEIMILLLIRQKDAYMSPVQAVRESFKDIKDHQIAVWAGVQSALSRLLERFDPHNLETRLERGLFDSLLPGNRKAKYWDLFNAEYQAIAGEAEDDFNKLFGEQFARAYEERLRTRD